MNTNSKKQANGCLWIVFVIVLTLFFFGLITLFTDLLVLIAAFLSLVPAILITTKLLGKPSVMGLLKNAVVIILIFMGLKTMANLLMDLVKSTRQSTGLTTEESVEETIRIEGSDTIPLYTSHRSWRDNYGNSYSSDLSVRTRDYVNLKDWQKRFVPISTDNFWGDLYRYMDQTDAPSLDLVFQAFETIHSEKRLNQMEFAEMVVTCIQDIPYSFVFPDRCLPPNYYDDSIRRVLEGCPNCCIGNIPFGVQNPVSFIQNLKGDCDTRTVLIYSILKHFNYDVAIANSDFYRHSVMGINLPASGLHKIYRGKKYMLWETTAKHFEVGYLPPDFDDVTHWNIVLTSK